MATGTLVPPVPMTGTPPQAAVITAKSHLRTWVRKQLEQKGDLRAPEVVELALAHFEPNQAFMAQLGAELLPGAIYDFVLEALADTRLPPGGDGIFYGAPISGATAGTDSRAALKRRLAVVTRRYARWREHVGDRHMHLLDMTPEDCRVAAAERGAQSLALAQRQAFLEDLASRGEKGKPIGTTLSIEEIEFIRAAKMPAKPAKPKKAKKQNTNDGKANGHI